MVLFDINRQHVPRRNRDDDSLFEHSEEYLLKRYRFPRATLYRFCEDLRPSLLTEYRGTNVSVATQVAVALRVLGEGNFQRPSADIYGLSQPSVSRIVEKFCQAVITTYQASYIKFPQSNDDIQATKTQFFNRYGIPNVLGCIDCADVEIKAPIVNEHLFVNRHQRHSINIQAVCNASMKFTDVVASFPAVPTTPSSSRRVSSDSVHRRRNGGGHRAPLEFCKGGTNSKVPSLKFHALSQFFFCST